MHWRACRGWPTESPSYDLVTVKMLESIARTDPTLALLVLALPWVSDSLQPGEVEAAGVLANTAAVDRELAFRLVGNRWLADSLNQRELSLLLSYENLAKTSPEVARSLASKHWLADGISYLELEAVGDLIRIADVDQARALQVLDLPWLRYDVTEFEGEMMRSLANLFRTDLELGDRVVNSPAIAASESFSLPLSYAADRLALVASSDLDLVNSVLETSPDPFSWRNRFFFPAIASLMLERRDAYNELVEQPWFADGLNDGEIAFLVAAQGILRNAPDEFFHLLDSRHVESGIVNLPLAGDVSITVIQSGPGHQDEDLTADIARALRHFEQFLGIPFPTDYVVVLVPSVGPDTEVEIHYSNLDLGWRVAGVWAGSHVTVIRSEGSRVRPSVLYHELAHYYLNFAHPAWLREGGANFLASLVKHWTGVESLENRQSFLRNQVEAGCLSSKVRNIHDLGERGSFLTTSPNRRCVYLMGEEFLVQLSLSLGLETTSAAFRDLLITIFSPDHPVPLQTKDVILAWWNNTPPERRADFIRLFQEMHGGPLSDFERYLTVVDDHGNSPSNASELPVSQWVQSDLGTPFDIDTFRLQAVEGTTYLLAFHHKYIDVETAAEDFYLTMTAADGIPSLLRMHGGGDLGIETIWTARRSGDYYLSVASTNGTLGHYSLLVSPGNYLPDDHGNDFLTATPLPVGTTAEGYLGLDTDVDYFYVDALRGHSYEVFVGHRTLQYSSITYHSPPGTEWENGLALIHAQQMARPRRRAILPRRGKPLLHSWSVLHHCDSDSSRNRRPRRRTVHSHAGPTGPTRAGGVGTLP